MTAPASRKSTYPRAIALDIETAPDPDAMARLALNPPDFRPMDQKAICKFLVDNLDGVGAKKAPSILEAIGGAQRFWDCVLQVDGAFVPLKVKDMIKKPEQLKEIATKAKHAEDAWWEKLTRDASFSARDGRVVCVALFDGEDGGTITLDECGGDEAELLRQMWKALERHFGWYEGGPNLPPVLVTFNGIDFDLPFLIMRSMVNRVRVPWALRGNRYSSAPVTDLYQHLTSWGRRTKPGKGNNGLLSFCRLFGLHHPTKEGGMDGSQVAQYVDDGRWEEIAEYCLDDTKLTWDLYERVRYSDPSIIPDFRRSVKRSR